MIKPNPDPVDGVVGGGGAAAPTPPPTVRGWLALAATAYLIFVIYGSLVPLDLQPVPWHEAVDRFAAIPYLALGIGSRADWVANLLLFVPLCFFWSGVIWPSGRGWRLPAALSLFALAVALSIAIEFVQIQFPQRTVSINDIVAETAGAAIGIGLWWAYGTAARRWLTSLALVRGTASVAQRLLWLYLAGLFGYNLLPLDLTISPVEVYHQWAEGKIVLMPFATRYDNVAEGLYELITDAVIWIPAAALWLLAGRKSRWQAWLSVVVAATTLEVLQLFVYSRVSATTDVITAAIGAAIGIALVRPRRWMPAPNDHAPARSAWPWWLLASLAWAGLLMVMFWYPFDFQVDRAFLRDRLAGLSRVPFEALYFGTEFKAITEVMRKSLAFAPLGFLLYMTAARLPAALPRSLAHVAALVLMAATAGVIEAGQLLLPSKYADLTDFGFELLGAVLGYCGSWIVASRMQTGPGAPLGRHRNMRPR